MSCDSPPPIPGLGRPPDPTSAEYNAEPQPFGSIDRYGSVKEEATLVNHSRSEHMESILKRRQKAYVQAELHRHRSLAAFSNDNASSRPLSSASASVSQDATKPSALRIRPRRALRGSTLTKSTRAQSLSSVEGSSEDTSEAERQPIEHQSDSIVDPERKAVPATSPEQRPYTPPVEEEVVEPGYMLLEQSGGEMSGENTPSLSASRERETRTEEPAVATRPAITRRNGVRGVQWGTNIELKIGLRMVYEEYKDYTQQEQADIWNEVFKEELMVANRRRIVPEDTMRKQWKERDRNLGTPSVREWREIVLAIHPTDQRWVDMKERFEVAIDELDRKNGWRT